MENKSIFIMVVATVLLQTIALPIDGDVALNLIESDQEKVSRVKTYLAQGKTDLAKSTFLSLNDKKDALVSQIVRDAFAGDKRNLRNVVLFTCSLQFFTTQVRAAKAVFQEMERNSLLNEVELLVVYYTLMRFINDPLFSRMPQILEAEYLSLRDKMVPHKAKLLSTLADEAKRNSLERCVVFINMMKTVDYRSLNTYAQEFFDKYSTDVEDFPAYMRFVNQLLSFENMCFALEAPWQSLKASGRGDTFEALQIWLFARYILYQSRAGDLSTNPDAAKCKLIYARPLTNMSSYVQDYTEFLHKKEYNTLIAWHKKYYHMWWFLADVIKNLPTEKLQGQEFNRLSSFVAMQPFFEGKCIGVSELQSQLKKRDMESGPEFLQNLAVSRNIVGDSKFKLVDSPFKEMCENVTKGSQDVDKMNQVRLGLARRQIQAGKIDLAVETFKSLLGRDEAVGSLVKEAYTGKKEALENVIRFISKLGFFKAQYTAVEAMFEEMERNDHLTEVELIPLYFILVRGIHDVNFPRLSQDLQSQFRDLRDKLQPYVTNLVTELSSEILNESFERTKHAQDLLEPMGSQVVDLFIKEVVSATFSGAPNELAPLLKYLATLLSFERQCNALNSVSKKFDELEKLGTDFTDEALQVWLFARYAIFESEHGDLSGTSLVAKCRPVYEKRPVRLPWHYHFYISNLYSGKNATLLGWHTQFSNMRWFLADVIRSFPRESFVNETLFQILSSFVSELPRAEDVCVSVSEIVAQLKNLNLLESPQGQKVTEIAQKVESQSVFGDMSAFYKAKCDTSNVCKSSQCQSQTGEAVDLPDLQTQTPWEGFEIIVPVLSR